MVFSPFYDERGVPETLNERRNELKGFILGVYRVEDMIERMIISTLPEGMNLVIFQNNKVNVENKLFGELIEGAPLQV